MAKLREIRLMKIDVSGNVVDGGRIWDTGTDFSRVMKKMPPRPETDYTKPVACYQCGKHRPEGREEAYCVPCFNAGHDYRLMGKAEMLWAAERDRRLGYDEVAARTERFAATL